MKMVNFLEGDKIVTASTGAFNADEVRFSGYVNKKGEDCVLAEYTAPDGEEWTVSAPVDGDKGGAEARAFSAIELSYAAKHREGLFP